MKARMVRKAVAWMPMLLLIAAPAFGATINDKFDKTWNVSPGGALVLSNENGSVEIASWDRSEVWVRADIRLKAGSSEAAKEAMKEFRIDARQEGDTISVRSRKPRDNDGFFAWLAGKNIEVDVRYEIMVPKRFNLEISTVNGGISGDALTGSLEFDTVNGSIKVVKSRGAVSADTVNGSIAVELMEIGGNDRMDFSTTNGRIEIALPQNAGADVDAATTNGKISSDIPLTSDSFSRSRVRGTLNGGGVPIKLRTVNGSIRILPAT